jgi:ATP-dependent DNA helicase RecG
LAGSALTEFILRADGKTRDALLLGEGKHLKRAAVLAFAENPERYVTGAYVKIGRITNDLLYYDDVREPLVSITDKTLDPIYSKYVHQAIGYEGIYRTETYPVPRAAVREAALNTIVHKDYATGLPKDALPRPMRSFQCQVALNLALKLAPMPVERSAQRSV